MKKFLLLLLTIICLQKLNAQNATPYFTSYPALTPDGQTLFFSYDGDLWKAASSGGTSMRITSMDGIATNPRVSPDGKWLAFSNSQFGNYDIYLMPLNGGVIKRLTFHSGNDNVESWSWDSKYIYFTSNRHDRMSTYKVNISGGTPLRVFSDDNFDYTHNAFEDPVTGEIFFDDTFESSFFANRLGYKGPFNPDIQSYNPATGKHKSYTNWKGKDMWATIDKKGNIYFVSDEANGQYNLYTFVNGKKTQLTNFSTSVMNPFVDAAGDKIVFEKDFQLFSYNIASKKAEKIPLDVFKNNTLASFQNLNVDGKITDFDVSGDGKKLAFVSRGKLFVSDSKGKFIREIKTMDQERVKEVHWLKDNKSLLYGQTFKGFENLFTKDVEGDESEEQITHDAKNSRALTFNSDKTKAVYLCGTDEVRILDLKSMKSTPIVKDEIWGLENSTPYFSPDDKYVMYTSHRNFEQDIFLYRVDDKQIFNITNTGVSETNPFWSPDGKYIYFISDRTHPSYPYGPEEEKIFRMPLQKITEPYRSDMFDSLFVKKKKETEKTDTSKKENKKQEIKKLKEKKEAETEASTASKKPVIKIDFNNLMDRIERVGPDFGNQSDLFVIKNEDKTYVFFISNHENGRRSLWKLTFEPFENTKTEKIKGADGSYIEIKGYKDHYYSLNHGDINNLSVDKNSLDKVDISFPFTINMNDEFNQMFYEAWADLQENYYNQNFNGVDWKSIRDRYASYLPQLQTRNDFRVLLNNMMGELNSSHYGFSTFGSDERTFYKTVTAAPELMFSRTNPYIVDHVIKDGCADVSDVDIKNGDELISVDGVKIDPALNREFYFMRSQMPDEMTLGFKRGSKTFEVKIHPSSPNEMQHHLYDEWIDANRRLVDQLSNKQIGYVYMKDMGMDELHQFELQMVSDSIEKRKALILDLRYNTGGNVHDKVLQFLSQRPYLQWKYRDGKMSPQPDFAPAAKPIILLVNEQTLSDGEMTAEGFKQLQLGKIVGTDTYHWIIFTSAMSLVDGSAVRLPSWGCYTLDGKNLEKNGVSPDIYVKNTFEDRMNNKDPQIEKAVEEILKELK
jgi:Tol biopolymer transport system component/C-terminal processing protease CtpA/Prc